MGGKVYLESSVISYLTSRPSRELLVAANQEHTRRWWGEHRQSFELVISRRVLDEISAGNPEEARKRLDAVEGIPAVEVTPEIKVLATEILKTANLPITAEDAAVHMAASAVHGVHFLITWNCRHIGNPRVIERMRLVCDREKLLCPIICTPRELLTNYVSESSIMDYEEDPILAEIHQYRAAHAARFNYDLSAIIEDDRRATEKLKAEGWPVVSGTPRKHPLFDGDPIEELRKLGEKQQAEKEAAERL